MSECSAHVVCQIGRVHARVWTWAVTVAVAIAVAIAVESRGLRDNLGGCRGRGGR